MKARVWMGRIALGIGIIIVGLYLAVFVWFQTSSYMHRADLKADSTIVDTALGPVEYAQSGTGPVILFAHGSPGGYDQANVAIQTAFPAGYSYLAVSRPGYLRTPLELGRTPSEQADAFAALLDELGIKQVAIVGASGGGPSAIEFARRHPDRVWGLILFVALTQKLDVEPTPPPSTVQKATDTLFGRGFMDWWFIQLVATFHDRLSFFHDVYPDSWPRLLADDKLMDHFIDLIYGSQGQSGARRAGYDNDMIQFSELDLGDVSNVKAPALVIHGTADTSAPSSGAEEILRQLDNADALWLKDGDHLAAISRLDEIRPAIVDFLAQHSQPIPREPR